MRSGVPMFLALEHLCSRSLLSNAKNITEKTVFSQLVDILEEKLANTLSDPVTVQARKNRYSIPVTNDDIIMRGGVAGKAGLAKIYAPRSISFFLFLIC
jgi:hypothetical protein